MIIIENKQDSIDIFIKGIITDQDGTDVVDTMRNAVNAGVKEITFRINSYGGSVKAAWDIIAEMRTLDVKTKAINEGFAISAASIILAAVDYAEAYDFSSALIHNPLMGGKTLEDTTGSTKEFLTKIKDGMLSIYEKKMKLPIESIVKMLNKETSFNAVEQKEIGLVDEIINKKLKPKINNSMELCDIYNIIEIHNKKENTMKEVINYLKLDEDASEQDILNLIKENESKLEEVNAKLNDANEQLNSVNSKVNELTVSNFILVNGLTEKEAKVNEAVAKFGVEVLETLINFMDKSEETVIVPVVNAELQEEILNLVNNANDIISNEITENAVNATIELANEIFDINGDNEKRQEIKNEQPDLYDKLVDLYYNS